MDFGCQRIRCISLIERTDKQESVIKLMKKLGLEFEFLAAFKDPERPARGCFRSHVKILADAYNDGVDRVLILEDDIELPKKGVDTEMVKKINRFLNQNNDWEVFNLGGCPYILTETMKPVKGYRGIYKGHFMATQSIILNRKGMKRYKDLKFGQKYESIDSIGSIDIDVLMRSKHSYAVFPMILWQSLISNDIGKDSRFKLKMRNWGLQVCNWYALNVNTPVYTLIWVFITIVVVIVAVVMYRKNRKIQNM